ncbi:MAG: toll/interleukin-1 receptor domain-containing protein [Lachnospiraceae bacterium]|nr:toll/interleukin-1 receptor domain-containing protein [Lachnospiraceae bacterium]
MQIFISYASENQAVAEQVCAYLEAQGKQCWIAPRDVPAGFHYGEEIIKGIENSDAFVLLYDAAANASQHVLREVERAVSKALPMVVYRLDDTPPSKSLEYFLLSTQWMDAKEDTERSLTQLNEALTRLLAKKEDSKEWIEAAIEAEEARNAAQDGEVKLDKPVKLSLVLIAIVVLAIALGGLFFAMKNSGNTEEIPTPTPIAKITEAVATEAPTEAPAVAQKAELRTGDYISLGSYVPGGEAAEEGEGEIEWQVVEAGESGVVLVSTRILSIRPFDCAESGKFDTDNNGVVYDWDTPEIYTPLQMMEFRGSNHWESSDLCTWLNTNGVVQYPGKVPQNAATDEYGNAYGTEAGFLTDFRKEEISLIANSGYGVFLLTAEQALQYAEAGTMRLETTPTDAAIAADETTWYANYKDAGATDYIWATSTAAEGSACEIYYVNTTLAEKVFNTMYAAAAGFGVRPAIRIFPEDVLWEGDGSRQNPYRLAD